MSLLRALGMADELLPRRMPVQWEVDDLLRGITSGGHGPSGTPLSGQPLPPPIPWKTVDDIGIAYGPKGGEPSHPVSYQQQLGADVQRDRVTGEIMAMAARGNASERYQKEVDAHNARKRKYDRKSRGGAALLAALITAGIPIGIAIGMANRAAEEETPEDIAPVEPPSFDERRDFEYDLQQTDRPGLGDLLRKRFQGIMEHGKR